MGGQDSGYRGLPEEVKEVRELVVSKSEGRTKVLFCFGCVGSSLLHVGFLSLRCAGFSLRCLLLLWSAGSRCTGFSSCDTRAQ